VIDSCAKLPGDPRVYKTFLNSRPKGTAHPDVLLSHFRHLDDAFDLVAEDRAIETVVKLLRETPYPAHIVHLASSSSIDTVAKAKRAGLPLSAEVSLHRCIVVV